PTPHGSTDAFVTKLNATGTALLFSTYVGGSGGDRAFAVATDASGNVYLTGDTGSPDFPTTPGAFQTTYNPGVGSHAFVAKLNPTATALLYSTYVGSTPTGPAPQDGALRIAIDSAGNAYVRGYTTSSGFPIVNAIASCQPGSNVQRTFPDGFALKLNS